MAVWLSAFILNLIILSLVKYLFSIALIFDGEKNNKCHYFTMLVQNSMLSAYYGITKSYILGMSSKSQ